MPIDIGRYNETFKAFADFAKAQMDDGKGKAVARAALGGRTVSAAAADRAFAFTRSQADKSANDIARDIFRQTVADMFGGESNIPPSVKDALLLKDYGAGKPLTARRSASASSRTAQDSTRTKSPAPTSSPTLRNSGRPRNIAFMICLA